MLYSVCLFFFFLLFRSGPRFLFVFRVVSVVSLSGLPVCLCVFDVLFLFFAFSFLVSAVSSPFRFFARVWFVLSGVAHSR